MLFPMQAAGRGGGDLYLRLRVTPGPIKTPNGPSGRYESWIAALRPALDWGKLRTRPQDGTTTHTHGRGAACELASWARD